MTTLGSLELCIVISKSNCVWLKSLLLNGKTFTTIKKSNNSKNNNEMSFCLFSLCLVMSDGHLFKMVFSTQCSVGLAGPKKNKKQHSVTAVYFFQFQFQSASSFCLGTTVILHSDGYLLLSAGPISECKELTIMLLKKKNQVAINYLKHSSDRGKVSVSLVKVFNK